MTNDTKTKVIAGATIILCAVIAALNCFTAYLQWRSMQPFDDACIASESNQHESPR